MANIMEHQPTTSLKRPADSSNDDRQIKKRQIAPPDTRVRRIVRPGELHFIKGGTASDPLNLSSIKPEIPKSPDKPLEILVPKNFRDPLNINKPPGPRSKKKKKDGLDDELIVSPVINPQRRHSIRGRGTNFPYLVDEFDLPCTSREETPVKSIKKRENNKRYRFGNFNRYYEDRQGGIIPDPRLGLMLDEWFYGKNVLDVGCNAGYLTLSVAKELCPRRILGIDIDSYLIGAARKNIRSMADKESKWSGKFPASFGVKFGPLSVPSTSVSHKFPDNIWFRCENYVLANDELLNKVREEYDTILSLNVTKWVHLNFGDVGIKRFFKRLFRELLPSGKLILVAQAFDSYKKRANMTEEIAQNFKDIKFMPDQFKDYLLSDEVGFKHCEDSGIYMPTYFGYTRPLQIYYKGELLGSKEESPQHVIPTMPLALQPTPVRQLQTEPEWDDEYVNELFENHDP